MNNEHDKLDDFLRDQLNDSSENASWNTPGDHVFENAINALPEKKKNNRAIWIILPLLFLAAFIGRELMHANQVNTLENKINSLEESFSTQSLSVVYANEQPHPELSQTSSLDETASNQSARVDDQSEPTSTTSAFSSSIISEEKPVSTTITNSQPNAQQLLAPVNAEGSIPKAQSRVSSAGMKTKTVANSSSEILTPSSPVLINSGFSSGLDSEQLPALNEFHITEDVNSKQQWITPLLMPLLISDLVVETTYPAIELSSPSIAVAHKSKVNKIMRYGILVGGNQSWLTMKNIPESPVTKLYEYDNSQSGAGAYAFIGKPLSKKISIEAGLGYQQYQNSSVLEDNFLFEGNHVIMMPDGNEVYQKQIDVINPLGDYSTMLAFRVSDQMQENDIINEYTTMNQKLHTVHFDMNIKYKILSLNRFDLSLGAGLGVGYLAKLENNFNISCYHNGQLQSTRTETPKNLSQTQKWYGQAIGKINIEYHLTDQLGLILETQYRSGISSLRRGTETNGSQTYIHAVLLSAGLTHTF